MYKRLTSIIVIGLFITISIGCITFNFVTQDDQGSIIEIGFETPIGPGITATATVTHTPQCTNCGPTTTASKITTLTPTITSTLVYTDTVTFLPFATILINANVRAGPETGYPVIAILAAGTETQVLGRNYRGNWIAIELPRKQIGWVAVGSVTFDFDVNVLPELQTTPLPTLPPTATWVPPTWVPYPF